MGSTLETQCPETGCNTKLSARIAYTHSLCDTHTHRTLETHNRARLVVGWGKDDWRTYVQPIRGKATDEAMLNRWWLYQKSVMGSPTCEPLFTYGINTCIFVSQGSTTFVKKIEDQVEVQQTLSHNNQDNSFSFSSSFTFYPDALHCNHGYLEVSKCFLVVILQVRVPKFCLLIRWQEVLTYSSYHHHVWLEWRFIPVW